MDDSDAPQPTGSSLPGNPGTLNVILHGLYAIEVKEEITVYIPNMGTDHVYRAGNWLAEGTLAGGDYRLQGIAGKRARYPFDPERNIVLEGVRARDANCCNRVYATLHLPLTGNVQSLGILSVPHKGIGGESVDRIVRGSGRYSATVQILTYTFASDADLRLGQHPWEPALDDGFVNLHVFSEPDQVPGDDHVRHAFQMTMGLFTGVDLFLRKPMQPLYREAEKELIPAGVHPLEVHSLLMRQQRLAALGRAIRDHRDLNGFWEAPTAFDGLGSCSGSGISDDGGN